MSLYRDFRLAAEPVLAAGGKIKLTDPEKTLAELVGRPIGSMVSPKLPAQLIRGAELRCHEIMTGFYLEIRLIFFNRLSQRVVVWATESGMLSAFCETRQGRKVTQKTYLKPMTVDGVSQILSLYSSLSPR